MNLFKHKCINHIKLATEIIDEKIELVGYCTKCGKKFVINNNSNIDLSKYNPKINYKKIMENSLEEK